VSPPFQNRPKKKTKHKVQSKIVYLTHKSEVFSGSGGVEIPPKEAQGTNVSKMLRTPSIHSVHGICIDDSSKKTP